MKRREKKDESLSPSTFEHIVPVHPSQSVLNLQALHVSGQ